MHELQKGYLTHVENIKAICSHHRWNGTGEKTKTRRTDIWRICWWASQVCSDIYFWDMTYRHCFLCLSWKFKQECWKSSPCGWTVTVQKDYRQPGNQTMGSCSLKRKQQNRIDTILRKTMANQLFSYWES